MSAVEAGPSTGKGTRSQDFDLNLASIIDCFTVLITYLLVSASFISISVFDVGVPSLSAAPANAPPPPPITLSIRLDDAKNTRILIKGAEDRSFSIPPKEDNWNFQALEELLQTTREKWPTLTSALIAADSRVEYRALVRGIEAVRKVLPSVFIGSQQVEGP